MVYDKKSKTDNLFVVAYYVTLHPALSVHRSIGPYVGPSHYGMWLVIASGMTIFLVLKTDLNLKETLAKNILAYVSVNFSIK